MPVEGEYAPSSAQWVRDQVEQYESSGGTGGTMLRGMPVIVMTMLGAKSGKVRKVPVMRVEHDGVYTAVASRGGAPTHPVWYWNLVANPHIEVTQKARERKEPHNQPIRRRKLDGQQPPIRLMMAAQQRSAEIQGQRQCDRQQDSQQQRSHSTREHLAAESDV